MNPFHWRLEYQIALLLAALLGGAAGLVIGYFTYARQWGRDGIADFGVWSWTCRFFWGPLVCRSGYSGSLMWSAAGALFAVVLVYIRVLLKD